MINLKQALEVAKKLIVEQKELIRIVDSHDRKERKEEKGILR